MAEFYAALNARDLAAMANNWDQGSEAAMDNPLGGLLRGWGDIAKTYRRLFDLGATYRFEFHDYQLYRAEDVFFVVGRERGVIRSSDVRMDLAIRTTRLFVRRPDRWRQVHHHGSIDDAEMLSRYQALVRGDG